MAYNRKLDVSFAIHRGPGTVSICADRGVFINGKGVEDIQNAGWDVGKVLGEGAFGKVVFVTRKSDGVTAACKIITKPKEVKKMKLVEMEYKARNAPAWRARTACAACARAPSHPPLGASLSCRL